MTEKRPELTESLAAEYRALDKDQVEAAERERTEMINRFPRENWSTMPLERYALGQEKSADTFCYWMEFGSLHLGSIRGGRARKLIIYKHKNMPGWYFDPEYTDEQEAWRKVRDAFIKAFQKADVNDWNTIDELTPLQSGPAFRTKVLHLYFPEQVFPIYSQEHLRHFLRVLNWPEADDRSLGVTRLNRALLSAVRERHEFKDWSSIEIMFFLYRWANPREQLRVVKIAPGHDAKYWRLST